jgi:hypothetical protein
MVEKAVSAVASGSGSITLHEIKLSSDHGREKADELDARPEKGTVAAPANSTVLLEHATTAIQHVSIKQADIALSMVALWCCGNAK